MPITDRDIEELVAATDRGRARWISGQSESSDDDPGYRKADDMTIFGPFGGTGPPPTIASEDLAALHAAMSAQFHGGEGAGELVRAIIEGDLVVLVMIERNTVTFDGFDGPQPWVLRTTQVFRRDGDGWVRLHRHAGPLIGMRSLPATVSIAKGG